MFSIRTDRCSSPRPETLKQSAESVSSTRRETSVFSSRIRRSRRWREVTYLPSLPASGLSFTMKFMEIVGSEIFWNGMETGLSRSPQRVSPMWISGIPETATIEPMPASVTSTFFSPSNSYNLLTFTFFFLVRSWWLTSITSWFTRIVPFSTLPTPIRPTYSL